jgi:hypothetical protein
MCIDPAIGQRHVIEDADVREEDEYPGYPNTNKREKERVRDGLLVVEYTKLQTLVKVVSAPAEEVGHLKQDAGYPYCCGHRETILIMLID